MTLADHAEIWAHDNDIPVPEDKESTEWFDMYKQWVGFAFSDFPDELETV